VRDKRSVETASMADDGDTMSLV